MPAEMAVFLFSFQSGIPFLVDMGMCVVCGLVTRFSRACVRACCLDMEGREGRGGGWMDGWMDEMRWGGLERGEGGGCGYGVCIYCFGD